MSSVFIPEEAKPYCNHMGIINWHAITELIRQERGVESYLESGYQLGLILEGTMEDKRGALPIMRRLKLDEIISARRHNRHHPHFIKSKELAERFAADFDIDISQVPGTGPDGMVLKRDVVAYRRFLKAGKIAVIQSLETAAEDDDASKPVRCPSNQDRLLRQRRILARHIYRMKMAEREAVSTLDAASRAIHNLHGEVDAANIRTDDATDRLAATSERLAEALIDKLAVESRLSRAEQMCDALRADLYKACTDRTNAIARAIAAEERAAQADRILSQILSELHAPRTLRRTGTWLDHVIGFLFRLSPKEAHA